MTRTDATEWPAPTAEAERIDASVLVPGSKSLTNRALILAGLAEAPSIIGFPLVSRDSTLMAGALEALGVHVERAEDGWRVTPAPLTGPAEIDCGLAGTVMRFVPPLAALANGRVRLDGDPHARTRPMSAITGALRDLGVDIHGDGLPLQINGSGHVRGGGVRIDASASSQFVSGLLLSGARYDEGLTITHVGRPVPSLPHIDMTIETLRTVGVEVEAEGTDCWRVAPGPVRAWTSVIEPDLSNATPFLAAAAITGGTVRIPNWPAVTTQPGDQIRTILALLGAEVELDDGTLRVTGPDAGRLAGVDLDLHEASELTPTIAAMALFADGVTRISGVAHIRGHETDRIAALVADIRSVGGDADETEDGLVIRPRPLTGGLWGAYADHRMATAGAIVGLRVHDVRVDDIGCTAKTLPDFAAMWHRMLSGALTGATS